MPTEINSYLMQLWMEVFQNCLGRVVTRITSSDIVDAANMADLAIEKLKAANLSSHP